MKSALLLVAPLVALLLTGCPPSNDEPAQAGQGQSGGPTGAGPDPSAAASVTPLPQSALVYVSEVRSGAHHIQALDVGTGKSTLVSTLDDDGKHGTKVNGIALSPDRKWVAFSAYFRISDDDVKGATGLPTEAIWVVSVDGAVFRRVAAPVLPPPSSPCTTDFDCRATGEICNTFYRHCDKQADTRDFYVRSWSPDGRAIVLQYGQSWIEPNGTIAGGTGAWAVEAAGGVPDGAPSVNGACPVVDPGDIRNGELLAFRGVGLYTGCGQDGIYTLSVPPKGTGTPLVMAGAGIGLELAAPRWLPDGSGFVFGAAVSTKSKWIYRYDMATKASTQVAHLGDDGLIDGIAVDPSGSYGAVEYFQTNPSRRNLFLVTLATGAVKPLTSDGTSASPSW